MNRRGFFATVVGFVVAPFLATRPPKSWRERVLALKWPKPPLLKVINRRQFEAQISKAFAAGSDNKVIVIPRTKPTIDAMWRRYARSLDE